MNNIVKHQTSNVGHEASKALRSALCALSLLLVVMFSGGSPAHAAVKSPTADLCFKCHPKLKEQMAQKFVHFPFKQGKCGSCHDMHVSSNKGLMKEDIKSLCLSCHDDIRNLLKKANIHGALKKGVCTDCHAAHGSGNRHLLVREEKNLCWNCHEKLKEQLNKPHVHAPLKAGECASCHNPHGSTERNQLVSAPNKMCKSCHAPRCKANGVSIASATKDLNCSSCHSGHSTAAKGLLGPYGHSFFLSKSCEQCHNPIAADRKVTTKADGEKLCFNCHKYDPAKFRDNDVHKNNEKGGCTMCHSYHASARKELTVQESKLCVTCHEATEKRISAMEKTLKNIRCAPVKDRKCFECHVPMHSSQPLYLRGASKILTCGRCHEVQHKISHPMGEGTFDPRYNEPISCLSCHSMHNARYEFMMPYDRKRQLCIQCHNR